MLIFSDTVKHFLLWIFHFYLCYTTADSFSVTGENEERKCSQFSELRNHLKVSLNAFVSLLITQRVVYVTLVLCFS